MQAVSQGLSTAAQDALRAALEPGEAICAFVTGFAGSAIVVTDRRVHFFARRPGTKGALRSWPVGAVVDIERPQFSLTIVLSGASPMSLVPTMIPSLRAPVDEVRDALRAAHRQHPVEFHPAADPTGERLAKLTGNWTLPALVRTYPGTDEGLGLFAAETRVLGGHGYKVASQSQEGGHLHAGRVIATGGLSIVAGKSGIRSTGSLTAAFEKTLAGGGPADESADLLRRLGELRDSGVLTQAEFDAKKTETLRRI
jgi:hypothetical protein